MSVALGGHWLGTSSETLRKGNGYLFGLEPGIIRDLKSQNTSVNALSKTSMKQDRAQWVNLNSSPFTQVCSVGHLSKT